MSILTDFNGESFDELHFSLLLSGPNAPTQVGSDYVVHQLAGIGLAQYDNWTGPDVADPDPADIVSINTFLPSSPNDNIIEYTITNGAGITSPSVGGIGAELVGVSSAGYLFEQLDGYVPGPSAVIVPDGTYFMLSTQDISLFDGSIQPDQTFTFSPLCFLPGSGIATPSGEVLVEALVVGDLVVTASGAVRPIVWIGTGQVMTRRGERTAATPVIVRKGALGPLGPNRDLRVTKAHSFLLDGVLIPAEFLINHRSILWDDHSPLGFTLYHIELETHDVLLANGAPAESYRDDGNRWLFDNANSGWDQPAKPSCVPVVTGGPIVDAVWRRLLDQAGPRPGLLLTGEPDLHLLVNGMRVDGKRDASGAYVFPLPAAERFAEVRIVSRAAAPDELGISRDRRVLGVALRQVVVSGGTRSWALDAADPRLAEGFHYYEPEAELRWTDGDAKLPVALFEGFGHGTVVTLHVVGATRYLADERCREAA